MILALLYFVLFVACCVMWWAAARISSPWRRARRSRRALAQFAAQAIAEHRTGKTVPLEDLTSETAERAYATADAKRRERFTQRYQQSLAKEGISPALAAEEARRIYADINSLGVT